MHNTTLCRGRRKIVVVPLGGGGWGPVTRGGAWFKAGLATV